MSRSFRWLAAGVLALGISLPRPALAATPDSGQEVASVDQLESQAVDALHQGEFDKGSQLFNQAAAVNPLLDNVAAWASKFDTEEHSCLAERQEEFEKNVKDIHTLLDHGMKNYAIDAVAQAYLCVLTEMRSGMRNGLMG